MLNCPPRLSLTGAQADPDLNDQPALFLATLREADPDDFWPIFLEWYPRLGHTASIKGRLVRLLRAAGDVRRYLPSIDRVFMDGLSPDVQVLRGAPRFQRKGLEWAPTYQAAEAAARRCRAATGSGNVYEGMIARKDIFAVLPTDFGEQTLIVDYARVMDLQLLKPEDVRSREGFIARHLLTADEMRQLQLQPPNTDGGPNWERYKWQPTPPPMLSGVSTAMLETKLEDIHDRLAAAHLDREILNLEGELRGIKAELAWRGRNPGKDPKARWSKEKPKPKGKSPGRPLKKPKV